MKKENEKTKLERFEKVYQLHVKNVYKACLYYARDEKKARAILEQVFVDLYKHFDDVTPDYAYEYMVRQVKCLIEGDEIMELAAEYQEVTV